VLQGTGAKSILIDKCDIRGGPYDRARCIMVDDGGERHYPLGAQGYANGTVTIQRSGIYGSPLSSSRKSIVKLQTIDPWQDPVPLVAEWVSIKDCGIWGSGAIVSLDDVERASVKRCNAPYLERFARARGWATAQEAQLKFAGRPFVPVSEGLEGA